MTGVHEQVCVGCGNQNGEDYNILLKSSFFKLRETMSLSVTAIKNCQDYGSIKRKGRNRTNFNSNCGDDDFDDE